MSGYLFGYFVMQIYLTIFVGYLCFFLVKSCRYIRVMCSCIWNEQMVCIPHSFCLFSLLMNWPWWKETDFHRNVDAADTSSFSSIFEYVCVVYNCVLMCCTNYTYHLLSRCIDFKLCVDLACIYSMI